MKRILFLAFIFISCEKELLTEQVCCDWDAVNFDPEYNGHNVNQLYFTAPKALGLCLAIIYRLIVYLRIILYNFDIFLRLVIL